MVRCFSDGLMNQNQGGFMNYPIPIETTASYCEMDKQFMRLAILEAEKASTQGEVPVGAVLIQRNQILATGHNEREWRQDPMAHAEVAVIQRAASRLNSWRLEDTTLYVTLEPCLMCAGAILQARITRLVIGTMDPKAGACGSLFSVHQDFRLNHQVSVQSGVLEEPCRTLLQTFFRRLRQSDMTSEPH